MRLGTAIEILFDNYRYALDKEWIQDKVAWALYYTWKEADETKNSSEKPHCIHTDCYYYDHFDADVCGRCTSKDEQTEREDE